MTTTGEYRILGTYNGAERRITDFTEFVGHNIPIFFSPIMFYTARSVLVVQGTG